MMQLASPIKVNGVGPDSATIMVVADYPSKGEAAQETALVDKVGGQVDRLLKKAGSSLAAVYRTCFIKQPVPALEVRSLNKRAREKIIYETQQNEFYKQLLIQEIEAIKPNIIIALGEMALQFLTHEKGIYQFRGSILPINPLLKLSFQPKVIPTLHPRDIWQNIESMAYVTCDYQKAIKHQYYSNKIEFKHNYLIWIARTFSQFQTWWLERGRYGKRLTYDIETYLNHITCVALCHDGKEALSVALWNYASTEEQRLVWQLLAKILKSAIPKANQNIGFDSYFSNCWGLRLNNICDDTMLLGHCIYPELPKNLGFYNSIYTDIPYYKDEGKNFDPKLHSFDQYQYYNAKDALVTWQILEGMYEDAEEMGVLKFYQGWEHDISHYNVYSGNNINTDTSGERTNQDSTSSSLVSNDSSCIDISNNIIEQVEKRKIKLGMMPLFHIYQKINLRGIQVDEFQRYKLLRKYNMLYEMHVNNLRRAYGKNDFNVRSPTQVGKFLYEYLGIPAITHKTDSGKEAYDTDKETIENLYINGRLADTTKTAIKEVIIARKIATIINYVKAVTSHDGRLRTGFNLVGADTGRTTGSSFIEDEYYIDEKGSIDYLEVGMSLQVLPKRPYEQEEFEGETYGSDIPSMFVPSPGYVFIEGDGKAAEAGVVCVLSKDYDALDYMYWRKTTKKNRFGCKDDIHVLTAEWCTGKSFDSITQYERENYGKRPRHAGNYDQTKYGLSVWIHKPKDQCGVILERFHSNSPKIRTTFHAEVKQCLDRERKLVNPYGRRRDFFGRMGDSLYRVGFAQIPQSTVSDHTKFSTIILDALLPSSSCLCEKHDGLLYEVPTEDAGKFAETFKKVYERPIDFRQCSLPRDFDLIIPAEVKMSKDNWLDMTEI